MSIKVKFWGVRGSIATPSVDHMKYGGNTSCVELLINDRIIILDAGTGVRMLGNCLLSRNMKDYLFLQSHTHWDHINGFPFFAPIYRDDVNIQIYAGHLAHTCGIQHVLSSQMCQPTFPVPFSELAANLSFEDFQSGESFSLGDGINVKTAPLNHPDGGTGYRIEHDGVSVCYVTDTEHVIGETDENVLGLIEGADLVIYDSTYTEAEYPQFVGWGHSTWQEGVRLCQMAGVRNLAIFHHDPSHDDDFMDQVAKDAADAWHGAFVAREGMVVDVTRTETRALETVGC
ncbi:MBL fold metallo-hydrolase [Sneathiella chinensis]|uniref:MBL fold metallo-hydrolase n=1 Tax=Sneathiella chinensis TaxID=349750 RepID=A0ABQ5U1H3_9PROT|nr:MBL fold metallo-hydrolase [Sneathiella chinensis]GLQ06032.1 MBL fold metallo-hydrolase [Sneathiella chinensis]